MADVIKCADSGHVYGIKQGGHPATPNRCRPIISQPTWTASRMRQRVRPPTRAVTQIFEDRRALLFLCYFHVLITSGAVDISTCAAYSDGHESHLPCRRTLTQTRRP